MRQAATAAYSGEHDSEEEADAREDTAEAAAASDKTKKVLASLIKRVLGI